MTLKQLEAFYWAATCASFAIAAERLHLSISSLSKRINELEQSLGVGLFDRSGHKAELSEAGRRLVPRAWNLLQEAEAVRRCVAVDTGLTGRCRIGVGELTALTWLPRLLKLARHEHPDLVVEPTVEVGAALEHGLESGQLDCAVIAGRSPRPDICSERIGEARFSWVIASDTEPLASAMSDRLLDAHPLITLALGAGTTRLLDDWLNDSGLDVRQRLICNNWGAIAGLVSEGVGVGMLPAAWAAELARRGRIRVLKSSPALGALPYSFRWRRDDTRPVVPGMLAIARQAIDFSARNRLL
ncbi:LysR family transcriptional regulator [Pigmentiphaga sp.]|uniref:LysR family transcriptional regulator n=1 Tax=Pigmentiphaga sp. TaxID=1977564 RepID=UPI00128CEE8C|nr:LysR family transcriptional regulator [Pigmentiphaga sp.]MPS26280.1 LysR family transcriptional regulator [Alcaligenaceae bacterium SAGV5]MPS52064.1 LysR family transcriptional regulator [Alcaligenaceae bacterium SAGV3]MPT55337.1 LysR family transcriptional regulator [Alcaligenaceae bacterium]